ncbi:MAG: Orotidine 5'-phosphate decarboxylase [Alphaproteobacteria bacterium MarineAlpha9_Bin6]|nr:MAG: Orotidine 5'-phosphate decarboxylase [Alphaproteobacteria bacterium MarineAlpha9_Bin6]
MVDKNCAGQVFYAIDTDDCDRAKSLALAVMGWVGGVKLGVEFFSANGPAGVEVLRRIGLPVFLDLKLFDIPNTVAGAIAASAHCQPAMITLHASGGGAMMRTAVEANQKVAEESGNVRPLLLGVTVLTSFNRDDLSETGVYSTVVEQVSRLAELAQASGLDGVVCSAHEIEILRSVCGEEFKLVVPGIRPTWARSDDQKRVLTPGEAVARGADYLVIGRPISCADDPAAAARRISAEIADATVMA